MNIMTRVCTGLGGKTGTCSEYEDFKIHYDRDEDFEHYNITNKKGGAGYEKGEVRVEKSMGTWNKKMFEETSRNLFGGRN